MALKIQTILSSLKYFTQLNYTLSQRPPLTPKTPSKYPFPSPLPQKGNMNNLKGKRVSYLASDCLHFSKHGIKDQFCCSIFSRFLLLCSCIHLIHPFDCIDTTSSFQANWFQFVSFDVVDDRYGHGRPANLCCNISCRN